MDLDDVTWRKTTYSGGGCVEVANRPEALVAVRDSKDPAGPALTFSTSDWREFLTRATPR